MCPRMGERPDAFEWRDEIGQALDRLRPHYREAFLLRYVEGLDYAEMSEMTGAKEPALRMRVKRASDQLRSCCETSMSAEPRRRSSTTSAPAAGRRRAAASRCGSTRRWTRVRSTGSRPSRTGSAARESPVGRLDRRRRSRGRYPARRACPIGATTPARASAVALEQAALAADARPVRCGWRPPPRPVSPSWATSTTGIPPPRRSGARRDGGTWIGGAPAQAGPLPLHLPDRRPPLGAATRARAGGRERLRRAGLGAHGELMRVGRSVAASRSSSRSPRPRSRAGPPSRRAPRRRPPPSQVQQVVDSARRSGASRPSRWSRRRSRAARWAPADDRIVAAVQALHGQLGRAREALGGQASDAELTAAAGAFRAGLAPARSGGCSRCGRIGRWWFPSPC